MDLNEFIEKSNLKHNHRYDYSKVVYTNNKTKVTITCKQHGDFEQSPKSHYLFGCGCQNCYGNKRLTTENFIIKAIEVHGDKYSYDKSVYKNNNTRLIITCKEHGEYQQSPKSHLRGFGCQLCSGLKRLETSDFINRSKIIHNNKYSYTQTEYVNSKTKVKIVCPKHGVFEQIPSNHLNGAGCRDCKIDSMFSSKNDFIKKSISIHGNIYDYSQVEYLNSMEPVVIKCRIHGDFKQTPHGHINGRGCSKCKMSKSESYVEQLLLSNKIEFKKQITFKDLGRLRFDFGLFMNNKIYCLIECNGVQHYKFIKYFHKKEKNFVDSLKRDNMKIDYCNKNNLTLHIIKHDDDVDEKIKDILNGLQHSH